MSADGKVLIETLLDTTKAEKSAKGLGGSLKSGIAKGAKVATGAMVAIGSATTATAGAMVKATKATMEYGVEVNRNSQKLNMSKQGYQEWSYVLKRSGTSIDSLRMGMKKISTQIDEARNGSKSATENFKRLGLSVDDLKGKSQEEIFGLMVERLQGIKDTTERSAIANKFFGRSAQEMAGLLNKSGKDVEALKKQAHDLGLVLSDDAIKKSAEFRGKITELQSAFEGLRNKMAVKFLPALTKVTDGLSLIMQGKTDKGLKQIQDGIQAFTKELNKAVPTILKIGGTLLKSLGKAIIDNLPLLLDAGAKIIVALIRGFAKALPILLRELPKILKTVKDAFLNALGVLGKQLPAQFKPLISIIEVTVKAFSGLVELLTSSSTAGQILRGVIMGIAGAYIAYKTAIAIATVATQLFTAVMDANPIFLVASAIGAVVGIITMLVSASGEATQVVTKESEATDRLMQSHEDLTRSLEESKKAREQAVQDAQAQAYEADILWQKIKDLNDVEHKSKEQKKEMKDLVEQLNEIYPNLHLQYDKEKDKLNQTNGEIKKNIDLMKQKAFAKAYTEQAQETITAIAKIKAEQKKLREQEIENQNAIDKSRESRELAFDTLQLLMDKYGGDFARMKDDWIDWGDALADETVVMKALNEGASDFSEDQKQTFKELWNTAKVANGGVIANKKALKQTQKAISDNDKELKNLNDEYGIYQSLIADTNYTEKAIKQLDKMANSAKGSAKKTIKNIQTQLANGEITVEEASQKLADAGIKGLDKDKSGKKTSKKSEDSGKNLLKGFLKGLKNLGFIKDIDKASQDIANTAIKGIKKKGKEGSPWKTTKESGEWAVEGFVEGIKSKQTEADKAMANVALTSVGGLNRQLKASTDFSAGTLQTAISQSVDLRANVSQAVQEGFENANVKFNVGERDFARLVKGA